MQDVVFHYYQETCYPDGVVGREMWHALNGKADIPEYLAHEDTGCIFGTLALSTKPLPGAGTPGIVVLTEDGNKDVTLFSSTEITSTEDSTLICARVLQDFEEIPSKLADFLKNSGLTIKYPMGLNG